MRSKLLVTASVPCAYYFYSSTRSQSCLMEGEESPLHRMQKQIDDSGLPISLTNNFSLNLIAGGAIVMYWGAMWNLLDRYFLVKRIPNPTANSVLRIVVGLGILAFQDNDIKEIGDKWDGLEDEEEDDENAEDVVQKSNLGSLVSESVFLASRGYSWCGDDTSVSREQIESIFRSADANKNDKLDGKDEIFMFRKNLMLQLKAEAKKNANEPSNEEEEEEEEVDRFRDIERFLESNGMSLNLHHSYFQNIWLGTGIITVWSGMENFFNAMFGFRGKILGHVFFNNFSRMLLAAALLYLPGGTLNDIGDGFLEDEEEENHAELHRQELETCILNALSKNEKASFIIEEGGNVSISLKSVLEAYDRLDSNGDGVICTRELILSLAKQE